MGPLDRRGPRVLPRLGLLALRVYLCPLPELLHKDIRDAGLFRHLRRRQRRFEQLRFDAQEHRIPKTKFALRFLLLRLTAVGGRLDSDTISQKTSPLPLPQNPSRPLCTSTQAPQSPYPRPRNPQRRITS